jgi:predicted pyridoxine 5'-phosphate oxidase superfamily flavin-nucleotide-binding protein
MLLHSLQTPAVERAQKAAYGRSRSLPTPSDSNQPLGSEEVAFISARDSFYLASVGETGWPYVQHRGGPRGFLGVIDASHLAFADYPGNRQLITTGNVSTTDRVSLFLMNYPARERLKIIGHARVHPPDDVPNLLPQLIAPPGKRIERVFVIEVVGFDWNCPQYITPRFTAEEVAEATQSLRDRITELETLLATKGG